MAKTFGKLLLSAAAAAVLCASIILTLAPTARAIEPVYNGNYVYCINGKQCGCIAVTLPYDCYWN